MSPPEAIGPFRPGPGRYPPFFAGRETEQSRFRAVLDLLKRRKPPPSEIVLYGPRGNGKTALLLWLEKWIEQQAGLEAIRLSPSSYRNATSLTKAIVRESVWRKLLPQRVSPRWFTRAAGKRETPEFETALARRVARKPLVMLLDEAHRLDSDLGRPVLNASQQVGGRLPFLLVLAGTPDLPARLNALGVSFWNRCERRRIGRLDGEATAAAFAEPFRAEGVPIDSAALARLVEVSHGYPYFVQILGNELWAQVTGPSGSADRRVSQETVVAALPGFRDEQRRYYRHRYDEMDSRKLLPAARAVAAAFAKGRSELSDEDLRAAVARGLGKKPGAGKTAAAERELRHLGFVWRAGVERVWEPGIPSLMDYVLEHTPKR